MTDHGTGPSRELIDATFDSWLPGAMFPSELVWLERAIRTSGADIVIECGRQDGVSTWILATMLQHAGVHILSIDFDDDPEKLARARRSLEGLPATCVSGDIHVEVPRLLRENRGAKVAVVQDGPKGWEGLATLLAAAHEPGVALIAQHNLHVGHVTRTVFQMLSLDACFLESAEPDDPLLEELREREIAELPARGANRAVDHTSLGVIHLDEAGRAHLLEAVRVLRPVMAPWDPVRVVAHWDKGDLAYCSRLRARQRYSLARFKRR